MVSKEGRKCHHIQTGYPIQGSRHHRFSLEDVRPCFKDMVCVEDAIDAVRGYLVDDHTKYHGRINFNKEYFRQQKRKCDSDNDVRYVV